MRQEIPQNEANVFGFTMTATFLGLVCCLGLYGMFAWDIGWGSLVAGSLCGFVVFIWRINQHDERGWKIIETWQEDSTRQPVSEVIIRSPGREWVYIENDRGRQYIFQPDSGVFAAFVRESINENNRMQFSQRQASERGWTIAEYDVVIAQLRAVDWLTKEIRNGAPVFNRTRYDEIRDWLKYSSPYPDED